MKPLFYTKTLIALAVAVAAITSPVNRAQGQPAPPDQPAAAPDQATAPALPANIAPGSPLAEVVKMIQAGVDASTIKGYIQNSQTAFNLDADGILYLKDMGAQSDIINAILDRDKVLYASSVTPPAPAPAPVSAPAPDPTPAAAPAPEAVPEAAPGPAVAVAPPVEDVPPPPTAPVTVEYFNSTLTPYGSWVEVEGYGRCWRPTVVVYNSGWSPYCDSGHWVYTDCGWYWDSDYSWGVTFHYGRWFRNPRFGWCWYPDTVWAPSWVAWRSGGEYCGWAPLPPYAEFRSGGGFYYRGASVAVDFDFGLGADCFVFVSAGHFCDRRPRSFCVPHEHITEVYHHTTIINNYYVENKTIVNRGFGPDRIASATHRPIQPVHVASMPTAGRQGWRGEGAVRNPGAPGGHDTPRPAPGRPSNNNNAGHNPVSGGNPGVHGSAGNNNSTHTPPVVGNGNNDFHRVGNNERPMANSTPINHENGIHNVPSAQAAGQSPGTVRTPAGHNPPIANAGAGQPQSPAAVHQAPQFPQRNPAANSAPVNAPNQFQPNRNIAPAGNGNPVAQQPGPQFQQRAANIPETPRPNVGQAQPRSFTPPGPGGQGGNPGGQGAQPSQGGQVRGPVNNPNNGNNGGNAPHRGPNKQDQ